jgi:hypothetical protein
MNNNLFQLTFPDEGWKETTVYTFEGPHDGGVQHNMVLTIDTNVPKDLSLKDYAKGQHEVTTRLLPGYEFVGGKDAAILPGVPAYEITYKYIPAEEVVLFQKQWFMVIDNKAYIFTSTFNKKTLNTIINDVIAIIASLKVSSVF